MTSVTLYNVLKLLHILAAVAFAGGIFARQIVRAFANRSDDVAQFAALHQAAAKVELWMIRPGSLIILALGIVMAWQTGLPMLGVLQGGNQNWLLVSLVLYVTGMALVPTVFLPRGKKFRPLLESALAQGRMTAELRHAVHDPVVKAAHVYEMIMLVAMFALMTLKPF